MYQIYKIANEMKAQLLAEGGDVSEVVDGVETDPNGTDTLEFEENPSESPETSEEGMEGEMEGEVEVEAIPEVESEEIVDEGVNDDSLMAYFTKNIDLKPDDITTDISSTATKGKATIEMNTGDKIEFSFSGFSKEGDGEKTGKEVVNLKINKKKITPVVAKKMGYKGRLKDLYDLEHLADFYFGYYLPDTYKCFEGCEDELTENQNDKDDEAISEHI